MERAIADGASGYLFKPATAAELKSLIDRFVFSASP
jgi:hypothetical protein